MGKELKDGAVPLGRAGLKPHQTSTVQVMFVAGSPRAPAVRPQGLKDAAAAPASAAAGGSSQPQPPRQADTNDAVLAAAAAAGCNVSALVGGAGASAEGEDAASPAEAWRAMAGLEEQLSRESDQSEEASVRQASAVLRQMLTTATHDTNSGLMQFAQ
ncbi:unnamed protein product, partial [Effrenium voratum]